MSARGARGRGGPRVGSGGPSATKLPATAATGQPYGEATTQLQAQKQVPMATGPLPPGAAPSAPPPGAGPPDISGILAGLRPLAGPTQTPNTPITHGLPSGPGAGPEAFQQFRPDPMATAKAVLSSLPSTYVTPQLAALRNALGATANNANSPNVQAPQ